MTQSRIRYLRLNPLLDEQVVKESERRGMNISEFMRYALTLFFEPRVDSGTHNVDRRLVDPGAEYATKER